MKTVQTDLFAPGIVLHRFEEAGLGVAPFRFTGVVTEKTYCACQGAPVQPGSTCDYCGTCIRYEFWVADAMGREFKVGCDCIHKTGDTGLIRAISTAESKLRRDKARARKLAKDAADRELCETTNLNTLHGPHPTPYRAALGETLADWARWMFETRHYGTLAATIRLKKVNT